VQVRIPSKPSAFNIKGRCRFATPSFYSCCGDTAELESGYRRVEWVGWNLRFTDLIPYSLQNRLRT